MCPSTCVPNVDAQHQIRWLSNSKHKYYIDYIHQIDYTEAFYSTASTRWWKDIDHPLCNSFVTGVDLLWRVVSTMDNAECRLSCKWSMVNWFGWLQLLRNITTFLEDKIAISFFRWIFFVLFFEMGFFGVCFFVGICFRSPQILEQMENF